MLNSSPCLTQLVSLLRTVEQHAQALLGGHYLFFQFAVCGPGLLGLDGEQVEFAGERFQDADNVQAVLFQLAVLLC